MITGSVAALFYGEPRFTNDVDFVVALQPEDLPRLQEAFPLDDFYGPPPEVLQDEAGRPRRGHFNLIHHKSGFKADIYLAGLGPGARSRGGIQGGNPSPSLHPNTSS